VTLPSLRPGYLASWPCFRAVAEGVTRAFSGKVIELPTALGRAELDDTVDLLALFFGLRVRVLADADALRGGLDGPALLVLPVPLGPQPAPAAVADSVVLVARPWRSGTRSLQLPQELLELRNALLECVGRQYSGQRFAEAVPWVSMATDTPATALRFLDGARRHWLLDPDASDATLLSAGLAAALGMLLRGVDERIVEWLVALAVAGKEAHRYVGPRASSLGRDEALKRALQHGLVHRLARSRHQSVLLRRPLELLGRMDEAPGEPSLAELASHLHLKRDATCWRMLRKLGAKSTRKLELDEPAPLAGFVGRERVLQHLIALLEPQDQVVTCVLYGATGAGKTTVAARLAEELSPRLEPVWLSFEAGPLAGWAPVASALGLATSAEEKEQGPAAGRVPGWLGRVFSKLKSGEYLVIVDDVDSVDEHQLADWLPAGPGRCAVLVIGRAAQRPLQQARDAEAVRLGGMSPEESRALLGRKAPRLRERIADGQADEIVERLAGHPMALSLAGRYLDADGLEDTLRGMVSDGEAAVAEVIWRSLGELSEPERRLVEALRVCAPAGAPAELVGRVAGIVASQVEGLLKGMAARSLVACGRHSAQLNRLVRRLLEDELAEPFDGQEALELGHAEQTAALFERARAQGEVSAQHHLYADLLLAARRAPALCRALGEEAARASYGVAEELGRYPRGDRALNLRRARAALRAVRLAYAPERFAAERERAEQQLRQVEKQLAALKAASARAGG